MDPIKDAFNKVRQDIDSLKDSLKSISEELLSIKRTLSDFQATIPTQKEEKQTIQHIIPTHNSIPTDNLPLEGLKRPIYQFSTGNRGVPTDRQTDQQTDQQSPKFPHLDHVSTVLDSLDSIKEALRKKFKNLTSQEMLVFSTIYSLEESGLTTDYALIASKLGLSESSIRDYVLKLAKKGIPVLKFKENNKKIILSISPDIKKIASLDTLKTLREQ